jgi:hypothetical protein
MCQRPFGTRKISAGIPPSPAPSISFYLTADVPFDGASASNENADVAYARCQLNRFFDGVESAKTAPPGSTTITGDRFFKAPAGASPRQSTVKKL